MGFTSCSFSFVWGYCAMHYHGKESNHDLLYQYVDFIQANAYQYVVSHHTQNWLCQVVWSEIVHVRGKFLEFQGLWSESGGCVISIEDMSIHFLLVRIMFSSVRRWCFNEALNSWDFGNYVLLREIIWGDFWLICSDVSERIEERECWFRSDLCTFSSRFEHQFKCI